MEPLFKTFPDLLRTRFHFFLHKSSPLMSSMSYPAHAHARAMIEDKIMVQIAYVV